MLGYSEPVRHYQWCVNSLSLWQGYCINIYVYYNAAIKWHIDGRSHYIYAHDDPYLILMLLRQENLIGGNFPGIYLAVD